jgi:hypothetical protein
VSLSGICSWNQTRIRPESDFMGSQRQWREIGGEIGGK